MNTKLATTGHGKRFDDVLRRMLSMRPEPHKSEKTKKTKKKVESKKKKPA